VEKLVVGCKLPSGIILEVDDVRVVIAGANSSAVVHGFGITENVPKEFWDEFTRRNPDFAPIKNGQLFIQATSRDAKANARDAEKLETGFEPLAQDKAVPGITKMKDD